jgi:hypothetical protein
MLTPVPLSIIPPWVSHPGETGKVVPAEKYVSAIALIRPSLILLSAQESAMESYQSVA